MELGLFAAIEDVALRIERAYLRRHPDWRRAGVPAQVWSIAASTLVDLHRQDPALPIDPELFVATLPPSESDGDPWEDLTQAAAVRSYRRRVRRIVRTLRRELRDEVRHAESRIEDGEPIESVLLVPSRALSALGCYIVARRADRLDLAEGFRTEAEAQHRACPLYRPSSRPMLASEAYPVYDHLPGLGSRSRSNPAAPSFSLN